MPKELSGSRWVGEFPTSNKLEDLDSSFQTNVNRFRSALLKAGAQIEVTATLRPPERAYLMHFSFQVANGLDPAKVPSMAGVDIQWVHPTLDQSVEAAKAMVSGYGIVFAPALVSRHSEGKAIDWTITWVKDLVITDGDKKEVTIATSPRNGQNKLLWPVGKSFGVVKLPTDPPHWSTDGH